MVEGALVIAALVVGMLVVITAYVLVNYAYLAVLGHDGLANSNAPAADVMSRVFGAPGAKLIAIGVTRQGGHGGELVAEVVRHEQRAVAQVLRLAGLVGPALGRAVGGRAQLRGEAEFAVVCHRPMLPQLVVGAPVRAQPANLPVTKRSRRK